MPWPRSSKNWSRIHIDFFKLEGTEFLLIIDSCSRWLDVYIMKGTDANKTIEKLRHSFAIFGLPEEVVADNGPPFNSAEFHRFCRTNGIKITNTPPYHPTSNGLPPYRKEREYD
ncbi:Integrase core domain [Popillia japonica]|uniref:Integrase core domain n=1 Tax=Popillia japonica TaxID=7064 RepID=A0AAW1JUK8_POPJA